MKEKFFDQMKQPLVIAMAVLTIGAIIISLIVAGRLYQLRGGANTVTVTGSATKDITSDIAHWQASYSREVGPDGIKAGTAQINEDTKIIRQFLKTNGVKESEINFDQPSVNPKYEYNYDKMGGGGQRFVGYTISQSFTIESSDIQTVTNAAKNSGTLLSNGIIFQSSPLQYYYSKLADLKIELLSNASKDANARAQKIADNSGVGLGGLRSATMGVIQITPVNSPDISDYGYYDTSSIQKRIQVTVRSVYFVR